MKRPSNWTEEVEAAAWHSLMRREEAESQGRVDRAVIALASAIGDVIADRIIEDDGCGI